jgi:penicillin-binding protein 1A
MWRLFRILLGMAAILGIAVLLFAVYLQQQLPSVAAIKEVQLEVPLRVYSADKKLIAEFGEQRRIPVKLADVPQQLIDAVLATEDRRFYQHPGVDVRGLMRASMHLLLSGGERAQGGSTITMQVARNFFLTREKSFIRKFNEILLAFKIEQELTKDEILELYLNKVFFGKRAYGVAAAAQVYYGKELNQLTLAETATIAGLPQAPSAINPINNPKAAYIRRKHVLENMFEYDFITQDEFNKAVDAPISTNYHGADIAVPAPYVGEMVRRELLNYLGDDIYTSGYSVYTTVDSGMQRAANRALQNGLLAYDERHGYRGPENQWTAINPQDEAARARWQESLQAISTVNELQPAAVLKVEDSSALVLLASGQEITLPWEGLSWARKDLGQLRVSYNPKTAHDVLKPGSVIRVRQFDKQWRLAQIPKIEGAFVALNPLDGSVLALTGGFSYELSKFNRATQAERQPGSTFKPFIYSAALANGYTAASVVNDAPIVVQDYSTQGWWRPQNNSREFYGPTRLRVGLTKSLNLVSVRLLEQIGIKKTINHLTQFGFSKENIPSNLTVALGTLVTTPLELTDAFAVFANGGYLVTPHYIRTIVDINNQTVYTARPPEACPACNTGAVTTFKENVAPQIISSDNAYIMTSILQDVIKRGTGAKAMNLKRNDLAGKTGTTNDQRDAWFVGYNSEIIATAWLGFDNYEPTGEYGSNAALPIWMDFMGVALNEKPENAPVQPTSIITARIDPATGLLAREGQGNAINEFFAPGTVPRRGAAPAENPYVIRGEGDKVESLF